MASIRLGRTTLIGQALQDYLMMPFNIGGREADLLTARGRIIEAAGVEDPRHAAASDNNYIAFKEVESTHKELRMTLC